MARASALLKNHHSLFAMSIRVFTYGLRTRAGQSGRQAGLRLRLPVRWGEVGAPGLVHVDTRWQAGHFWQTNPRAFAFEALRTHARLSAESA